MKKIKARIINSINWVLGFGKISASGVSYVTVEEKNGRWMDYEVQPDTICHLIAHMGDWEIYELDIVESEDGDDFVYQYNDLGILDLYNWCRIERQLSNPVMFKPNLADSLAFWNQKIIGNVYDSIEELTDKEVIPSEGFTPRLGSPFEEKGFGHVMRENNCLD